MTTSELTAGTQAGPTTTAPSGAILGLIGSVLGALGYVCRFSAANTRSTTWVRRAAMLVVASVSSLLLSPAAQAESPARERELTCSDGTVFIGEQVRHGRSRPPSVWHGVTGGNERVAFVFRAVTLTAPDGTVDEAESWDNTAGVQRSHELITCSFVIPVGPLTGYQAEFVGFFVPAR